MLCIGPDGICGRSLTIPTCQIQPMKKMTSSLSASNGSITFCDSYACSDNLCQDIVEESS